MTLLVILPGALAPMIERHHASITDPKGVGALLRAIETYNGSFVTKCALRLAPLVFVRPSELRMAEWPEFDLDKAEWCIPAARMKMRSPHIVPLAHQAVEVITELRPFTGDGRLLFPGVLSKERPMSDNTQCGLATVGVYARRDDRAWLSQHGLDVLE